MPYRTNEDQWDAVLETARALANEPVRGYVAGRRATLEAAVARLETALAHATAADGGAPRLDEMRATLTALHARIEEARSWPDHVITPPEPPARVVVVPAPLAPTATPKLSAHARETARGLQLRAIEMALYTQVADGAYRTLSGAHRYPPGYVSTDARAELRAILERARADALRELERAIRTPAEGHETVDKALRAEWQRVTERLEAIERLLATHDER